MKSSRVFGLDVMRATAILLVVFSHSNIFLKPSHPVTIRLFNFAGYIGVELFFVLSGFLIGMIVLRIFSRQHTGRDLQYFWIRRWFRTLPNYYLFLLIHYLAWNALDLRVEPIGPYLIFLQNLNAGGQTFFPVSWSLTIEEWFYIIFPTTLWISFKLKRTPTSKTLVHCLAVITILLVSFISIRFLLVSTGELEWGKDIRLRLITRLDAPIYGVFGAYIALAHPALWKKYRFHCFVAGIFLFALVSLVYFAGNEIGNSFYMKTTFFTLPNTAFLLWLPVLSNWKAYSGKLATTVTLISLWSYSLYLCHDVIRRITYYGYIHLVQQGYSSALAFATLYVAIAIILARLCYTYYEKPMMNLRERFNPTNNP